MTAAMRPRRFIPLVIDMAPRAVNDLTGGTASPGMGVLWPLRCLRMKVLTVVGNRPQFIKAAPLSLALREAGIEEVSLHTGQHYDRELSADLLRRARAARARLLARHCASADAGADAARRSRRRSRPSGPTGCSSSATRTRRSRARRPASRRRSRSRTSRRGSGAATSRCRRSGTASRSTGSPALLLCPDERSRATLLRPRASRAGSRSSAT